MRTPQKPHSVKHSPQREQPLTKQERGNPIATIQHPQEIQLIVDALDDKRAKDITVLDLTDVSETLTYFIVASGESSVQLKALEDGVKEHLKANGFPPKSIEGPSARWTLLNYGDIVVHIMSPDAREFYDLEGLWADAARLEVQAS